MKAINPASGEVIREYAEHGPAEVEAMLRRAETAYGEWRRRPMAQRSELMQRAAGVLRAKATELAAIMTQEMGKPIAAAEAEVEKCAMACDYFAQHAQELLKKEEVTSDATRSYVRFDPLGPILAVMPWNFPFWQVFRFAAPSLMAGNVGLLKHASNVPGCALAIEQVFHEAGFPQSVFTTLLISGREAEALIGNPIIRAVTLTGSGQAGMSVGAAAGKALKKSVLELGGSDPFIVLRDVDVDSVAESAAGARCINSGQSCIAAKRFIVEDAIAERFETALAERMRRMRVGDPMDRNMALGPLAREDLVDVLHDQVERSVSQGARLLAGGRRLDRRGFFYEPTVLAGVRPGMAAFDEETFGPVAAVTRARGPEDAVMLANHSRYGLGASIWTNDLDLAEHLVREIEAGCVFVNGAVKSDPRLPFGGVKESGYGRELSQVGIREFVNIKTVWVKETRQGSRAMAERSE